MKIIHKYMLTTYLRNLFFGSLAFSSLFLIFDFFDKLDNIFEEGASVGTVFQYYMFKLPVVFSLTLPIAVIVSTMLTVGLLSKHSEITAMRASGLKVFWICSPLIYASIILSIFTIGINETVIPYANRRVREIYNIDIRKKDTSGAFSQDNFWWRSGDDLYSVNLFDSRIDTLIGLSRFSVSEDFSVTRQTEADAVKWVNPILGWSMHDVRDYFFKESTSPGTRELESLTLPISESPKDFYHARTDVLSMSFSQLRRFIKRQQLNGVSTRNYIADLYSKISFPFVSVVVTLVMIPFALKPARSGSLAISFIAGLAVALCYYAVHSLSLSLGRAELFPPFIAAWTGNFLMLVVGLVLNLGAEAPER